MQSYDILPPFVPEFETPTPDPAPPEPRFEFPPTAPLPEAKPHAPGDTADPKEKKRRLANKIARLPADTRERLNRFLHDGLSYTDVIAELGEAGAHLNKIDLSRWVNE